MRLGAVTLLEEFGSPLNVAVALIEGYISPGYQEYVKDIVDPLILEAAKIRIQLKLNQLEPNK